MKTMNNNNIESVKNVVVANNETVMECLTVNGVVHDYPVAQPVGERVGFINSERGFSNVNVGVAINEPHGWRLDHTIYFDFAHNAYVKSRMSLEQLIDVTAEQIGIKDDDMSVWARDLRTIIGDYIEHFDEYLESDRYLDEDEQGNPAKLNEALTGIIFDGIVLHEDIHYLAVEVRAA